MKIFLGNRRAENYKELLKKLLKSLLDIGAYMSVEVHFWLSYLDKFPDSCGHVSDEQGEQFHQDIKTMEEPYRGRWDKLMITDYFRSIKRDSNNIEHDNQERENFYHSCYVKEGFISVVSLLNDLLKVLIGLDAFNRFIFKDIESDCHCKNRISQ